MPEHNNNRINLIKIAFESIKIELNSLDDYIKETAKTIVSKQNELEKLYEDARNKNPEDSALDSYFDDEFFRYHELFPTFSFNSILVSQFSFFESRLKLLCELSHWKIHTKLKYNDLNGSDIEKFRKYLRLVVGIDFKKFQNQWNRISDIQKLRNAIIHNSSIISNENENKHILKIIKAENRIVYSENKGNFYINDVTFLTDFSTVLLDFFTLLVEELSRNKVVAINTSMPYDNTYWGQEKTEKLLKSVIDVLDILEENEKRTDEHKDSDMKFNIKSSMGTMSNNLTKLYAFFGDGEWEVEHKKLIIEQRDKGLKQLKKIYNTN